jgi:hypothetical protein
MRVRSNVSLQRVAPKRLAIHAQAQVYASQCQCLWRQASSDPGPGRVSSRHSQDTTIDTESKIALVVGGYVNFEESRLGARWMVSAQQKLPFD